MSMTPSERLDRRQSGDQWEGFVRWSSGPGQNRIGWYDYASLRTT